MSTHMSVRLREQSAVASLDTSVIVDVLQTIGIVRAEISRRRVQGSLAGDGSKAPELETGLSGMNDRP